MQMLVGIFVYVTRYDGASACESLPRAGLV
jgi:hypothetical protein